MLGGNKHYTRRAPETRVERILSILPSTPLKLLFRPTNQPIERFMQGRVVVGWIGIDLYGV